MDEAAGAKVLRDMLHEAGYKAQIMDENIVRSAASGLKFYIQPYRSSIQFRCFLAIETESRVDATFVNETNKAYRFLKTYLDRDGDLVAESDWWIDLESPDRVELFDSALAMWDLGMTTVVQRLREQRAAGTTENAAED